MRETRSYVAVRYASDRLRVVVFSLDLKKVGAGFGELVGLQKRLAAEAIELGDRGFDGTFSQIRKRHVIPALNSVP